MSPQQQQIQLEAPAHSLQNALIDFDEEQFRFIMMSGGPARMYVVSPKHAKRLMLLLEKQVGEYEKKFAKLDTALPETRPGTNEPESVGFKTE